MRPRLTARRGSGLILALLLTGCGTTKMTDSPRAASEMLLISQAVDYAVAKIDFTPLSGETVYLDTSAIDKDAVDKGYLISMVRQQLLAHGASLQDEKGKALYIVELRTGAIGTDHRSVMVGTPAVSLPSIVPGLPTSIPEIALLKKSDQRGVVKIGVFAYNRITGRAVWQSGSAEAMSRLKDTWIFGTGPITRGTIRQRTEIAGEPIPDLSQAPQLFRKGEKDPSAAISPTSEQYYPNSGAPAPPLPIPAGALGVTGGPILSSQPLVR